MIAVVTEITTRYSTTTGLLFIKNRMKYIDSTIISKESSIFNRDPQLYKNDILLININKYLITAIIVDLQ